MKQHGNKYTAEQFIEKAIQKHGDRYDYSKVSYVSSQHKVGICCFTHGIFYQRPASHLWGSGCPHCNNDDKVARFQKDGDAFIQQAQEVHGVTYDYSAVVYKNARQKVEIICKDHGSFFQSPGDHLSGTKCPACMHKQRANKKRKTKEQFIEDAKRIHGDKYDYDTVVYQTTHTKVDIVCPTHGTFSMTPKDHLTGKQGCKKCIDKKQFSNIAIRWLEECAERGDVHIHHMGNSESEYVLPGTKIKVDGFCADTNTVYEFYGDKFHGNPTLFASGELCHPFNKNITAGELLCATKRKEETIRSLGYTLVTMWESDYRSA